MAAYKRFADLYDTFMKDAPYGEWADYVTGRLSNYGITPDRRGEKMEILELGCGTGNISELLCKAGYRVTGIDLSPDMVKMARRKRIPGFEAYVHDMRIPIAGKVGRCICIVSLGDSMNYIVDKYDMELTLKAAALQLASGGIFIFDLKTDDFYKNKLGDNVFTDSCDGSSYIWENYYDKERHINNYYITFYKKIVGNICLRFCEHHMQRAYGRKYICKLAEKYGLKLMECVRRGEREYYVFKKKEGISVWKTI